MVKRKKRKVVLFGAGAGGEAAWWKMRRNPVLFDDIYIAYSDNDEAKWGNDVHGINIVSPEELTNEYADLFVLCSRFADSIRVQLTEERKIKGEASTTFLDYERMLYCEEKYYRRYSGEGGKGESRFDLGNIVIYTAIFGDYDELHEPLFTDDGITYVCFTDNPRISSNIWKVVRIENDEADNVRMARKIKVNPHLFFKSYATSVWVDGKFQVIDDIRKYIGTYGGASPMLCFPHFDRECIYDEGGKCIFLGYGDKREIIDQMSAYYKGGYPFDNGLYETGCIVRRHNEPEVIKIMEDWMREIRRFSYRDQLSLPVVCDRNGFSPDISAVNCFGNRWLKFYEHKKWHGRV